MDVEGGLAAIGIGVDHLELHGVPGIPARRTDQATLPVAGNAREPPAALPSPLGGQPECEVDELDVVDRDVGAGVAALDPFGELAAADRLRLQERAVAV